MEPHQVQFIAITFDDGSVGVMQLILNPRIPPEAHDTLLGFDKETGLRESSDDVIQAEIEKSSFHQKPVSWVRIEQGDIPPDRSYRDAWKHDGKQFLHDMIKARAIHLDRLRAERAPKLEDLDVQYMQADEAKSTARKAAIAKQKQALRDAPEDPRIAAAATVEDLKALTLDALTAAA